VLLAALALAWLLGVAAAAFTGGNPAATIAAIGLLGLITFAIRPRWSTLAFIAAGAALVLAAGWRYEATTRSEAPIARFNDGHAVALRALVSDEPEEQGGSRLVRLDVRESRTTGGWREDSGGVLMRTPLFPEYQFGDVVEVRGRLETPPVFEDFDYRTYLFRRGVDSIVAYPAVRVIDQGQGSALRAVLYDLRSSVEESISRVLPNPEGPLAAGILLGTRSELPDDLTKDMQSTGTAHLVAVSGQNVVLVAALLMAFLAWVVGRRTAAWLALAGIAFYAAVVGAEPSVVRAAVMGALYVTAIAVGRRNTAFFALTIAAAVMTAHNPHIVHEVSFQLSFAATLGLILLTSPITRSVDNLLMRAPLAADFPLTRPLLDVMTMTVAATAFTLPIIAMNFERVSLVAPIANLFAVPAFVAVAATAALAAAAELALPGDASLIAWVAWPPAAYMIAVIGFFAEVPFASADIRGVNVEHAIAYYAALAAIVILFWRGRPERVEKVQTIVPTPRRMVPVGALGVVLCLAATLVWLAASAPSSGRLTVTFLDVGQGDAILIEGPDGHRILVDGGPSGTAITNALGRRLPFDDRRLDMVVLTHPQQDHLGGLSTVLDQYSVRSVLANSIEGDSFAYRAWADSLNANDIDPTEARRGQTIDLGHGAVLSVIGSGSDGAGAGANDSSLVLRLSMGEASFLLTGDITERGEATLLGTGTDIDSTVLKVAHHGSATSTSTAFLARTSPVIDVISVAADNRFGHPAPQTVQRLAGDRVLRTDLHGDVTLSTDGAYMWLSTQRRPAATSAR
jgi:competence protein ComEC